jgi:A/G-specific adenine glycosylase
MKSTLALFQRRVVSWFKKNGRNLPWRHTRDPYRVLVSEFMLQQTQVSRVEGFYHRFLEAYPDIHSLATAPAV